MSEQKPSEAEEWWISQRLDRAAKARKDARRAFGKASLLLDISDAAAEEAARRLLVVAAAAFWLAEDTELEDCVHEEMDDHGKWVRENFGCHLKYENGAYYQECPVAIAHKRLGVSMGFTAKKRLCSICAEDVTDCSHHSSRMYDVPGGIGPAGFCRVCGASDCEEHLAGRVYRAAPVNVVTEIAKVHEVSFVRKPAQPLARPTSIPVDMGSLKRSLGKDFWPGVHVSCDRCVKPCGGIEEIRGLEK